MLVPWNQVKALAHGGKAEPLLHHLLRLDLDVAGHLLHLLHLVQRHCDSNRRCLMSVLPELILLERLLHPVDLLLLHDAMAGVRKAQNVLLRITDVNKAWSRVCCFIGGWSLQVAECLTHKLETLGRLKITLLVMRLRCYGAGRGCAAQLLNRRAEEHDIWLLRLSFLLCCLMKSARSLCWGLRDLWLCGFGYRLSLALGNLLLQARVFVNEGRDHLVGVCELGLGCGRLGLELLPLAQELSVLLL